MKVRIVAPQGCRTRDGVTHRPGDVVDLGEHLALKLIRYGIAAAVRETVVETETLTPPETTAQHTKKTTRKTSPAFSPEGARK